MYNSLARQKIDFHLYIFAFDDKSFEILQKLNLANATIIPLREIEDERLLAVKAGRTKGEYCWTATTSTILYCLQKFNLERITYVDADIYFFNSPQPVLDQLGNKSVLLIEHHYAPQYDQSALSGKYCVQFMTFKNNEEGLRVLNWWKDQVIEWCFNRREDGKCGDQKYLDDWPERFSGAVAESKYWGGGVAPWNTLRFEFFREDGVIKIKEDEEVFNLVFYHFHNSQPYFWRRKINVFKGSFVLNKSLIIREIYTIYQQELNYCLHMIRALDNDFDKGVFPLKQILSGKIRNIIYLLKGKK